MDRRIQILRFWHLAIGSLLVAWIFPSVGLWIFSSFAFAPLGLMMPVFPAPDCGNCTTAFASQYQIDITGVFDDTADCGDCDQFNGTYTVTEVDYTLVAGGVSTGCYARFQINPCYCHGGVNRGADERFAINSLTLRILVSGSDSIVSFLFSGNNPSDPSAPADCHTISSTSQNGYIEWRETIAGGADCNGFSAEPIDYFASSPGTIACESDGTASTVTTL